MPWPSVVSPRSRPPSSISTVLAESARRASGDSSSQIAAVACLWGMVTFSPASPRAAAPRSACSSRAGSTGIAT